MVNYVAVRRKLCERLRIPTIEREGVWLFVRMGSPDGAWDGASSRALLELRIELARARIHFMRMGSRRRIFGSASSG